MSSQIKVRPWVGSNYGELSLLPFRTLVLGESNYTFESNYHPDLVIECVRNHIGENDDPNFSRFATKVRKVIVGDVPQAEVRQFWESIAFYNFVQSWVGEEARDRPTTEMWAESIEAFQELVHPLRVQRILVLGGGNWKNLLSNFSHENLSPCIARLKIGEDLFVAGYINHPSSFGFSYKKWRPLAQQILLTELRN